MVLRYKHLEILNLFFFFQKMYQENYIFEDSSFHYKELTYRFNFMI